MAVLTSTELGATNRIIRFADTASQRDVGAQTVLAYCRPSGAGGGNLAYILSKSHATNAQYTRFFINHNSGSPILSFGTFGSGDTTSQFPERASGTGRVSYSAWQHLAYTWDGTNQLTGIKLYTGSGVDVTETAYGAGSSSSSPIGTDAGSDLVLMNRSTSDRHFAGDVAYIARWSRVLTLTELRQAQNEGPLAVPSGLILLWANQADLGPSALTPTSRSTFVAGALPPNTSLGPDADTTAPTLTSPTGAATGTTTATGSVSTNEGNGTLYAIATTNGATPTVVQIQTGNTASGVNAFYATSKAVASSGAQSVAVANLTAGTAYFWHFQHKDAAGNDSPVVTSPQFTTTATQVKGLRLPLTDKAGVARADTTGIVATWWDNSAGTGAYALQTTTAAISGGSLEWNLNAATALAVGGEGHLKLYKQGTSRETDWHFSSRLPVQNIA